MYIYFKSFIANPNMGLCTLVRNMELALHCHDWYKSITNEKDILAKIKGQ